MLSRPVVIPFNTVGQVHGCVYSRVINKVLLSRSASLRSYKELITEHKLLIESEGVLILRELVPHWPDDWGALLSCELERRIKVVCLRISLVNSVENDLLDSF